MSVVEKSGCEHFVWGERDSQKGNDMVYVHVIFFSLQARWF